jgi:hypothetical protein
MQPYVSSPLYTALKKRFSPANIKAMASEANELIMEITRDQVKAEKHIQKSLEVLDKSINNRFLRT